MPGPGFREAQATFDVAGLAPMIGQFRRLGEAGPAYEIMHIDGEMATAEIVSTDERLDFRIADVVADPIATTLP